MHKTIRTNFQNYLFIFIFTKFIDAYEIPSFPQDFNFGVATASYQIEGGWNINGKGENIWDYYSHYSPSMIKDGSNGDVSCDSYHKFKDDVQIIKDLGLHIYRFSLSWSRILPTGFANEINPDGIRYYNDLINELVANDIIPVVTIFHWDLPLPLMAIGGWSNPLIIKYFMEYANITFHYFGDRVHHWLTMNEPMSFCTDTYENAYRPFTVPQINGIGIYLCAHTVLRTHALVYRMYKNEYQEKQQGRIGIAIDSRWYEPKTNKTEDIEAAIRALEFDCGMYFNPIVYGDFPEIMKSRIVNLSHSENFPFSRLPEFTKDDKELLEGSYDFIGLNHYSTWLVSDAGSSKTNWRTPSYANDVGGIMEADSKWPNSTMSWLYDVPWGFYKLLTHIRDKYKNPIIVITENGFAQHEIQDTKRIHYLKGYLKSLSKAIRDGCNVKGYITWSVMDNFEWFDGYTQKFGLYYVNFTDPSRPRIPRSSAKWFKKFVQAHLKNNKKYHVDQV